MKRSAVLIINGHKDIVHLLSEMFRRRFGIVPTAVENVNEAKTLFARQMFDLVISDLDLPERGGHEIVQALKAQGTFTPLIFFTSITDIPADGLIHADYPCLTVERQDHRELLAIASEFI